MHIHIYMHMQAGLQIPYTYKFSRDIIFAVIAGNLSFTKIKSLKLKTIKMYMELKG